MSGDDKEKPMSTTTTISGDFADLFGKMAEQLATVKGIASLPGGGECKILGVEGVKDGAMYIVSGGMVAGVMSEDNARKARVETERRNAESVAKGAGNATVTGFDPVNFPYTIDTTNLSGEQRVEQQMAFIARNRERLIEAFIAETGCKPSEAELVEVRDRQRTWCAR